MVLFPLTHFWPSLGTLYSIPYVVDEFSSILAHHQYSNHHSIQPTTMAPLTFHHLFTLILTLILLALPTPTHAQADFMFAYYLPNTGCRAHVPPGSGKSQAIPTLADGQCVPVDNALGGDFDVEISGKVYWTNGVTPAIKACPTVDCDLEEGNGCCECDGLVYWGCAEVWGF